MNTSVSTITGKIKIKIVFLGNQAVGKSSVIQKYVHNKFQQTSHPTVGIDFLAKNITHKSKNFRLQLWDTAGQQRFQSLIPSYLKDAQLALILFDITNHSTFEKIQKWIQMYVQNKGCNGFMFLVGNKCDLQRDRQVSVQQGTSKAKQLGIPYFEISAKTSQNIQLLFNNIIEVCSEGTLDVVSYNVGDKCTEKIQEEEEKNQEDKDNNIQIGKKDNTNTNTIQLENKGKAQENTNNFKLETKDNDKNAKKTKKNNNCC